MKVWIVYRERDEDESPAVDSVHDTLEGANARLYEVAAVKMRALEEVGPEPRYRRPPRALPAHLQHLAWPPADPMPLGRNEYTDRAQFEAALPVWRDARIAALKAAGAWDEPAGMMLCVYLDSDSGHEVKSAAPAFDNTYELACEAAETERELQLAALKYANACDNYHDNRNCNTYELACEAAEALETAACTHVAACEADGAAYTEDVVRENMEGIRDAIDLLSAYAAQTHADDPPCVKILERLLRAHLDTAPAMAEDAEAAGGYLCDACGKTMPAVNGRESLACPHCGDNPYDITAKIEAGTWYCARCSGPNDNARITCHECGHEREQGDPT